MGSGYRVFTAGEVLTASNVQNYLQDQAVMVFGGTAARSSAIGTANFEEGMLTYLTDVDKLQVYTGATFADVYPAAASTQGLTLINTTSFSGVASVSLPANTFSATYTSYKIVLNLTPITGGYIFMRLRAAGSDTATNTYARSYIERATPFNNANETAQSSIWFGYGVSGLITSTEGHLLNPFEATVTLSSSSNTAKYGSNSGGINLMGGIQDSTTSFDSATFFMASGNISGSVSAYGLAK
jgi:hypothetical protein